LIVKEFRISKL